MNYPIPYPQTSANVAYFYSNNTNSLGSFNKPVDGRVQVSVDYSQLTPSISVNKVWFEIKPGGDPPLTIDSVVVASSLVTFYVAGGHADRSYDIMVNAIAASTSAVHSDTLTVAVIGDDGSSCDCTQIMNMNNYMEFGTQQVFVNRFPRFFVSATAPVNANLLDRWYNLIDGNWYDYVTNGMTDFWVLSIHGTPTDGGGGGGTDTGITGDITIKKMQPLPFDGTTTTFTLISTDGIVPTITTSHSLFVSLDGVWQEPDIQFTASGNSITFATPPPHDSYEFIMWIFGGIVSG